MRHYMIYAFAGFMLASCGREELPGPVENDHGGDEAIRFEIGIVPPKNEGQPQAGHQTRVVIDEQFKCSWEEGDEIGVFASLNNSWYISNAKLTYTNGAWISEEPLYWPKEKGVEMAFRAYYPYDAQFESEYDFSAAADQNAFTDGKSNFSRSDFMTSHRVTLAKGETVNLSFEHVYTLIHLTLDNSAGAIDPNKEVKVILRNVPTKIRFSLYNILTVSYKPYDTKGDIRMQRVERPGDPDYRTKFTFRALFHPSVNLTKGQSIFRITNGDLLLDGSKLTENILIMEKSLALLFTQRLPVRIHTVPISAGTFRMGSPDTDPNAQLNEKPRHWVRLTRDFRLSKYEVTRTQYAEFLNATGVKKANVGELVNGEVDGYGERNLFRINEEGWTPRWNEDTGKWEATGDYPMIYVTWYGAKAFADWVGGRLPTEAEWEYACRAGTETTFFYGDDAALLGDYAVYLHNPNQGPGSVGTKKPNAWGLYDICGNVCEWCMDGCDKIPDYPAAETEAGAIADPQGPGGSLRIMRDGSYCNRIDKCRPGYRYCNTAVTVGMDLGFRVAYDQ